MPSDKIPDTYLGDGVYASFDGYGITLDLRAQGNDRICLEPEVLDALDRYRKSIAGWRARDEQGSVTPPE